MGKRLVSFATMSLPSASCSSCEMTSIEFGALLGGAGDCEGAETAQGGGGGGADEAGILCAGDECTAGNRTSETTCQGPMRTPQSMPLVITITTFVNIHKLLSVDQYSDVR